MTRDSDLILALLFVAFVLGCMHLAQAMGWLA